MRQFKNLESSFITTKRHVHKDKKFIFMHNTENGNDNLIAN